MTEFCERFTAQQLMLRGASCTLCPFHAEQPMPGATLPPRGLSLLVLALSLQACSTTPHERAIRASRERADAVARSGYQPPDQTPVNSASRRGCERSSTLPARLSRWVTTSATRGSQRLASCPRSSVRRWPACGGGEVEPCHPPTCRLTAQSRQAGHPPRSLRVPAASDAMRDLSR